MYYILVYFQFILLTPLIGKLLSSKYKWIGCLVTPLAIVITRYIFTIKGIEFPYVSSFFFSWFIFYYLGMALGNGIIKYKKSMKNSFLIYTIAIILSIAEGLYWYKQNNIDLATTQLRITSIVTSIFACLIVYKYITNDKIKISNIWYNKLLIFIGDISFGIYFSHIAISLLITNVIGSNYLFFPIKSLLVIFLSIICVVIGKKILGKKYSKFLGL